jgi:hypothetical protein
MIFMKKNSKFEERVSKELLIFARF